MALPTIKAKMAPETRKLLSEMKNLITVGELSFSAGIAADIIAEEARQLAPLGDPAQGSNKTNTDTGNLRRAIVAWTDKTATSFGNVGVAHVGVIHKIAPHAHLVEFGTAGRRFPKNSKKLVFWIDGKKIVVDSVKPMPAQAFMRPAIDSKQGAAIAAISVDLTQRITLKLHKK